jgi:8-oxo-dGTP diphosphatase
MTRRQIRVVGAMLERDGGRYLITQRPPKASLPLLWEFPGGRVEGIDVEIGEQAMHTHHDYPHYDIDFRVYRCRLRSPEAQIQHLRVHDHRWVTLEEMGQYKFPDADARTLEKLLGL